ncbi:MAG: phosphatidate cytidylyltransferase [Oscillospiraceae bacterium]|nr:phosphatidate cytidylyltransferase [Oscillospiraceae bacterium]
MGKRIAVALVGIPFLLAVLVAAPYWATGLLLCVLSIIATHELMNAVCGAEKTRHWWGLAATTSVFVLAAVLFSDARFSNVPMQGIFLYFAAALVLLIFFAMVSRYGKRDALSLLDVCTMLLSGVAIPLALSALLRLRMLDHGAGLVLIPLVAAFCSDTMALFTGMALGRHKLSPKVSPKKTVEGAVGGMIGGMVGMILFRVIFYLCTVVPLDIGWCVVLGFVGAAAGQLGDLVFSAIKRQYGIKDYGRLLPGHGGVLDRFDSVIFAAPLIWLIVCTVSL